MSVSSMGLSGLLHVVNSRGGEDALGLELHIYNTTAEAAEFVVFFKQVWTRWKGDQEGSQQESLQPAVDLGSRRSTKKCKAATMQSPGLDPG